MHHVELSSRRVYTLAKTPAARAGVRAAAQDGDLGPYLRGTVLHGHQSVS